MNFSVASFRVWARSKETIYQVQGLVKNGRPRQCYKRQQNKMQKVHICRCLICVRSLEVVICATWTLCMPIRRKLPVDAFFPSQHLLRPSFHKFIQSPKHIHVLLPSILLIHAPLLADTSLEHILHMRTSPFQYGSPWYTYFPSPNKFEQSPLDFAECVHQNLENPNFMNMFATSTIRMIGEVKKLGYEV